MPLQNRVDPFGRIVAMSERGTLTGNRGIIHNESRQIVRQHASKGWITCVLDWKDVRRKVMTGHKWTELFFLDEATALAAGHRPCGYCRSSDYEGFVAAWALGNPDQAPQTGRRAPVIDAVMHTERRHHNGSKRTYAVNADELPPGVMYTAGGGDAWLVDEPGWARLWSFAGYTEEAPLPVGEVEVLTPPSVVNAISFGYRVSRVDRQRRPGGTGRFP
ncbi:MAG: hypothetical protein HKN91_04875 [Acidimicrobiia bacterium]|nr:hypothetical protein [Acidimicrobiia bacterium]